MTIMDRDDGGERMIEIGRLRNDDIMVGENHREDRGEDGDAPREQRRRSWPREDDH